MAKEISDLLRIADVAAHDIDSREHLPRSAPMPFGYVRNTDVCAFGRKGLCHCEPDTGRSRRDQHAASGDLTRWHRHIPTTAPSRRTRRSSSLIVARELRVMF